MFLGWLSDEERPEHASGAFFILAYGLTIYTVAYRLSIWTYAHLAPDFLKAAMAKLQY
jgi:membrane protein CcdC involved in cytochrome C biogenesis